MKNILFALLLIPLLAQSQQVELVKDFTSDATGESHSPSMQGAVWNNLYFYAGRSQYNEKELWVTDGTSEGTTMLKDINPGNPSSDPADFVSISNGVLFTAKDPAHGKELWFSDGTPEGTYLVLDIYEGTQTSSIQRLIPLGEEVIFVAASIENDGLALWKTDGTAEGTFSFFDPIDGGSVLVGEDYHELNGNLLLSLSIPAYGQEPWITDGTEEGTFLLMDIRVGNFTSSPSGYYAVGNQVFFKANDSNIGIELYRTDGTPEGTSLVKDISLGSSSSNPQAFVELNDELFFKATASGEEALWKSDGTEVGTVIVSDLENGEMGDEIVRIGDLIYFAADLPAEGIELIQSDGTTEGTLLVDDVLEGTADLDPIYLTVLNDKLFFNGSTANTGDELWVYDPATNTFEFIDVNTQGTQGGQPYLLFAFNDLLYFSAFSNGIGFETHVSDGTAAGTEPLIDLNDENNGAVNAGYVTLNDLVLFVGQVNEDSRQLVASQGTVASTAVVTDYVHEYSSSIRNLTIFDDRLFFRADDGENGTELWSSDGTPEGTTLHSDIRPGFGGSNLTQIFNVNDKLVMRGFVSGGYQMFGLDGYEGEVNLLLDIFGENDEDVDQVTKVGDEVFFSAYDQSGFGASPDLWKTDGTTAGTIKVKDFSSSGPNIDYCKEANGKLWWFAEYYFYAEDWGLYTSDGTEEGTYQVKQFNLNGNNYAADNLVAFDEGIIFSMYLNGVGSELYYSDGTEEGTYLIKDINIGGNSGVLSRIVKMNNEVYFFGNDGSSGLELWKSDGTEEGTVQVIDLVEGSEDGVLDPQLYVSTMEVFNGKVYFGGKTTEGDWELFSSDGTPEGTQQVFDVNPGGSSNPRAFYQATNYLYFTAENESFGTEPWRTNGIVTELVDDIAPVGLGSYPEAYQEWGDDLYFAASNGEGTLNLYKFDQRCIIPEITEIPNAICLGEELSVSAEIISSDGSTTSATWDFGNGNPVDGLSADFTFLTSGEQTITLHLETELGCTNESSFSLMVNETPVPSFETPASPLCISEAWEPTNQTTGSNENTDWSWNVDGQLSEDENPSLLFTESGTFEVVLAASNGNCEASFNANIEVYEPSLSEAIVQNVTCFGDETGGVEVAGEGNIQPVLFSVDGETFSEINSWYYFEAGGMTVFIQDGNGCIGSEVITIGEYEELDVSVTWGPDDGTGTLGFIDVSVVGGQPPYEYSIDGGVFQDSGLFENLLAGVYEVTIIDDYGCTTTVSVEVFPSVSVTESIGSSISIFPVPADQHIHLNIPSDWSNELLELLDIQGRVVATQLLTSGQNTFDVSMFSNGMYLARIPATGWTSQIQIQH